MSGLHAALIIEGVTLMSVILISNTVATRENTFLLSKAKKEEDTFDGARLNEKK